MKNSLLPITQQTSLEEQLTINQEFQKLNEKENLLPIKVTSFFRKKIEEEIAALGHTEGPLHRISYPSREKIELRVPGEVPDFVDDRSNMPRGVPNTIIRKYENRILFLPTSTCAGHCQYCFRQDVLSEQHENNDRSLEKKLRLLKEYLKANREVKEVILSGGDPMILPFEKLEAIIQCVQSESSVESIRVHTKTICYSPPVFEVKKLKLLGQAKVRMVFHVVHPYEICEEVKQTIAQIQSYNIRCYNQFPLLRNINDHADLLAYHLHRLDNLGVKNLSVFIPDPIHYSAAFRISLSRLFRIIDELNWKSPSWINATNFVLDSPVGKVRRTDIKHYDADTGIAIFEREGKLVEYRDFPPSLDHAGKIETLLWKGLI